MSQQQPTKKREKEREVLNRFLDKPVNFLIKHKITPDMLSYLGLFCMILAAVFIGLNTIHMIIIFAWPAPFLIFLAGTFDVFDGEVARRTGKEGPVGAYLDSNLDRISDAILILGLIFGGLVNFFWGFALLFFSIMISYTRSRAENEGVEMKGVGFMERAERILILFGALIIETWIYFLTTLITGEPWTVFNPWITSISVTWFFFLFIIGYTIALVITIAQRVFHTYQTVAKDLDKCPPEERQRTLMRRAL